MEQDDQPLVMVVGFEGSDPARRALAAAGRILRGQQGWIEVVYVSPTEGTEEGSARPEADVPPADVTDSLGPAPADLHYEVRSALEAEKQPWRLRSARGVVAEELLAAARELSAEGGPSRTVVIVVGSDRRQAFGVPNTLARRSAFPVVIVP